MKIWLLSKQTSIDIQINVLYKFRDHQMIKIYTNTIK